jgi:ADP-ribose pyrophosphatase
MSSKPTLVSQTQLFRAQYSSTELRQYRYSNGEIHDREMICTGSGVVIVPVLSDGRLVLIRQYRHAADDFILELPAGLIDPGEDEMNCARRELEEEAGYQSQSLKSLGYFYTSPGFTDERLFVVVASQLSECTKKPTSDEVITHVDLLTPREALHLISTTPSKSAPTLAALSLALAHSLILIGDT